MPDPTPAELAAARDTLRALARRPGPWPTHDPLVAELVREAARVVNRDRKQARTDDRRRDLDAAGSAGIRGGPGVAVGFARPRTCYACGDRFDRPHPFYDALCPACGAAHHDRRHRAIDLSGRAALVTGGRVGSGFRVVLKLLRAGADVVATTRFPTDAGRRFAAEPDAAGWSGRLRLVGLDLRPLPLVEAFAAGLRDELPHLDIFVANAAQTVRRPPAYYRRLADAERNPPPAIGAASTGECGRPDSLPPPLRGRVGGEGPGTGQLAGSGGPTPPTPTLPRKGGGSEEPERNADAVPWYAALSLAAVGPDDGSSEADFPPDPADPLGDPLDLRPANSWGLGQSQVTTAELAEAHAVNALAPFVLLRELRPLFRAGPPRDRFAVVVSAAEGRFAAAKTGRHPHTNMAKAAVNMLVRTSAGELAADRVYLTAVDPGWFSVQSAAPTADRFAEAGGRVPLDAEEAAARILDPVFAGIATGRPASGVLFKDYREVPW